MQLRKGSVLEAQGQIPAHRAMSAVTGAAITRPDLSPKSPPALRGVLGVKSLALGRHLVHRLSLQKLHRCQVAQC